MNPISRRNLLAASAAGGLLTAANAAAAQSGPVPQPQRPGRGGTDPGPRNLLRDRQNPDLLVPPSTDHGTLPNLRFSFSDSHVRLESGVTSRLRSRGIRRTSASNFIPSELRRSRMSYVAPCGSCSVARQARLGDQRPTVRSRSQVGGTAFTSSLRTFLLKLRDCALQA